MSRARYLRGVCLTVQRVCISICALQSKSVMLCLNIKYIVNYCIYCNRVRVINTLSVCKLYCFRFPELSIIYCIDKALCNGLRGVWRLATQDGCTEEFQDFKDDLEIEVGFTMDSGLGPSRVVKFWLVVYL